VAREVDGVALARRGYLPDFELTFERFYNFERRNGYGAMIAMTVPLPFKYRRDAALEEARSRLAGEDLRRQLLALAEVGAGAIIELGAGRATFAEGGKAASSIDLAELPTLRGEDVLLGSGTYDPHTTPLDADGQGIPYETYAFGAQVATVEVDTELGTTTVLGVVAAHDVGRAINPTQVEGQIHGGIAQGLGLALMEAYVPGRTENLHDYLIPTVGDIPPIECILVEDPEPAGPYGAKGVGEPALVPTAPAILGAIRDATGARITSVPATPERVLAGIAAAQRAPTTTRRLG